MTLSSSIAVRNASANAAAALMDAGSGAAKIKIRTGSKPATPATSPTGTLLATLTCSDPACGAAASGVLTFNTINDDTSADATGVAGWFRIEDSNGNAIFDGTITGTGGGGDVTFDDVNFVSGGVVGIDSLTITWPQ